MFSRFAQLLYPIIGGGCSTSAFVKTLYESILTSDGESILDSYSTNTLKAYFNGRTSTANISRKMLAYIEPECFVEYLSQFPDSVMTLIYEQFAPYIDSINPHNTAEKISYYFADIIKAAASEKRHNIRKKELFGPYSQTHSMDEDPSKWEAYPFSLDYIKRDLELSHDRGPQIYSRRRHDFISGKHSYYLRPERPGLDVPISKWITVVGRSKDKCDCCINSPWISAVHALVSAKEDGNICIQDVGSINGTYVNGIRLFPSTEYVLRPGDVVLFGPFRFFFEEAEPESDKTSAN